MTTVHIQPRMKMSVVKDPETMIDKLSPETLASGAKPLERGEIVRCPCGCDPPLCALVYVSVGGVVVIPGFQNDLSKDTLNGLIYVLERPEEVDDFISVDALTAIAEDPEAHRIRVTMVVMGTVVPAIARAFQRRPTLVGAQS